MNTQTTEPSRYRMRDLCRLTGLERQAIHYYIKEGLLPAGEKTGRNTALYGEAHVRRLQLIRRLQHERFLPLKAIRALLDQQDESFTRDQRRFLATIRDRLPSDWTGAPSDATMTLAQDVLARTGVEAAELDALVERGSVRARRAGDGQWLVAEEDVWVVESWAAFRAAGFSRELGFEAEVLELDDDVVQDLVRRQAALITPRLAGRDPAEVAEMMLSAMPVVHDYIVRLHRARIRDFLSATT